MRNGVLAFLLLAVFAVMLTACGDSESATAKPAAAKPAAEKPAAEKPAAEKPAAEKPASASLTLEEAAAQRAGGPGSFYIGDLSQLVGPAPGGAEASLGDANDMVNLAGLERERYLFDATYYSDLVKKSNFTNPTELVYDGEPIEIQVTCINRSLATCKLIDEVLVKNTNERTQGKINLVITSFPELGLSGPDSLSLVRDGTIAFTEITSGYVAGDLPQLELTFLYGLYPNHEIESKVNAAVQGYLENLIQESTGGGQVISRMWLGGGDNFFFCRDRITEAADFEGKKVRSHGAALSDWIEAFGANAQFVAFAEVYTALERGILDCGVTVAFAAHGQRWYEVADYMVGPLSSQLVNTMVMNEKVFSDLPEDLRQILIEEGARHELEAIRTTPAWNEVWTGRLVDAGLEYIPFTDEMKEIQANVAVPIHVLPNWIKRVGGPDTDIVRLFNEEVAPIVGLKINADGTTSPVPVTK
jgi:TRAP-type C4-dicarboxylate transport system substrate-binding protein